MMTGWMPYQVPYPPTSRFLTDFSFWSAFAHVLLHELQPLKSRAPHRVCGFITSVVATACLETWKCQLLQLSVVFDRSSVAPPQPLSCTCRGTHCAGGTLTPCADSFGDMDFDEEEEAQMVAAAAAIGPWMRVWL